MVQISDRIRDLVDYLNMHTYYYDKGEPKISDAEWDKLYFELKELEDKYGIRFNNSPTQNISYEVVNALEKVEHNHDMLSLDKTKSLDEVKSFINNEYYLAMCKMDGLTCSLHYLNGELVSAETRGNGKIGENILHNAKVIPNLPQKIPYLESLVIDGEIICATDDFMRFEKEYKNPRNFAAGSIRLLDSKECADRMLQFIAWEVIEGFHDEKYLSNKLAHLELLGFTVVPYLALNYEKDVEVLKQEAINMGYPIDGIVFKFDDIEYGKSLGQTSHHFKNAIAYKFYDETYPTTLEYIDWTMGRTGILTPVAVFEPIEIDGSTVNRASLHNISIMEELSGGFERVGDTLHIFKANQIIPQVSLWEHNGEYDEDKHLNIPTVCPICGAETAIKKEIDTKVLVCTNPSCEGKLINKLDHFAGKKGLDIKGLSKATLDKLIDWGWVSNYKDLFNLKNYRAEWIKKSGFGVKSVDNILNAIEASKNCELNAFIAALGIPLIGTTASKDLVKEFPTWEEYMSAVESGFHFWELPNFGFEMHSAITKFNYSEANELFNNYLTIKSSTAQSEQNNNLNNLNFVVTGKVNKFKNRDELKAVIEARGGKVTGSISSKTNYLINNDVNSTSSKNVSAKKLGIPIISEETFIEMFGI